MDYLEKYFKKSVPKMRRKDMINALMQEYINNPNFTKPQLYEIRRGIEQKVDYKQYADPSIPSSEMNQIRKEVINKRKMFQEQEKRRIMEENRIRNKKRKEEEKRKRKKIEGENNNGN
jgi:hypothetical protein